MFFWEEYSTVMELTDLVDNIATAMGKKLHTISVELEKSFDTIDHSLLLKKLEHYDIRGIVNHWLSSWKKLCGNHNFFNLNLCKLCVECHRDQS